MSIEVKNFGCRLNALEGDVIRQRAQQAGLTHATIINGCAVTASAMRQAGQAARRAKRDAPTDKIIVTGCAAQTDPARFAAMPQVDLVLGNEEKLTATAYKKRGLNHSDIMDKSRVTALPPAPQPNRARAFVQVQTGCDHRCSFCIIPFGRGNSRSVPVAQVVAQVEAQLASGHKEVVLTGVDITAYGADIGGVGLGALVRAILDNTDVPRLRLSSLDAVEIDNALLDLVIGEPRLMPHLHLSLQAGDNMILKRMKRRHSREQAIALCRHLKSRRRDIVFGADIIAGFPTETDAMFENSLRLIEECGLVWLHVFPFSPRPNTPAAKMPQLPDTTIKARAAALRKAGAKHRAGWLARQKNKVQQVLVEKADMGRCENFARIHIPQNRAKSGDIIAMRVSGHDGDALKGAVL